MALLSLCPKAGCCVLEICGNVSGSPCHVAECHLACYPDAQRLGAAIAWTVPMPYGWVFLCKGGQGCKNVEAVGVANVFTN